jgi:shikimate dehydrogenase
MQNKEPDLYGVVGHPVAHSRSPLIHGLFARQTGQNLIYRLHDVVPESFEREVAGLFKAGVRGLNVTVPHKQAAAAFAQRLTPRAARAGAVNTLAMQPDGRILGDNTDGTGLVIDLRMNQGVDLGGRSLLVLGAGGATRGILAPLLEFLPAELLVANRNPARAQDLVRLFGEPGPMRGCGFEEVPPRAFDVVINATSAGLGGGVPDILPAVIGPGTVCYDLSYSKGDTPFTRWAREHGCARAVQGWGMLVEQAAESFLLWRGVRPQTASVLALLESGGG